jgi:hypothetical protein
MRARLASYAARIRRSGKAASSLILSGCRSGREKEMAQAQPGRCNARELVTHAFEKLSRARSSSRMVGANGEMTHYGLYSVDKKTNSPVRTV